MGLPAGLKCSQQAQSALLLSGMGEHRAAVPLHTQQVSPLPFTPFILTLWSPMTVLYLFPIPNSLPPGCEFGQADMQKLVPKEEKPSGSAAASTASGSRRTGNISI